MMGIAIHNQADGEIDVIETLAPPSDLDVSVQGTNVAYVANFADGSSHVFVIDRNGGGEQQLTAGKAWHTAPVWSPNGDLLAYIEGRCDPHDCTSHVVVGHLATGCGRWNRGVAMADAFLVTRR